MSALRYRSFLVRNMQRRRLDVHTVAVFPLSDHAIEEVLVAALQEGKPISAYDLAILHDSVQHLQLVNRNRSYFLNRMGTVHMEQYRDSRSVKDLNQAVNVYNQALRHALWNDDRTLTYMSSYAISLHARYQHLGDVSDLNGSIVKFQEAVQLTPDGHSSKPSLLNNLGNSL